MSKIKILGITVCLILSTASLYGQKKLLKCEVIDNSGNTIIGQIEHKSTNRTPAYFDIVDSNNAIQSYSAKDIRSMTIYFENGNKDIYASFNVDVDFSSLDLKKLDTKAEPTLVNVTVFLRTLVNGKINLYGLFDDSDKRHYFVSKDGNSPKELTYRKYYYSVKGPDLPVTELTASTGVSQIKINTSYKNELFNLMSDNSQIEKKAYEDLEYKEKDLVDLVTSYNGNSATYIRPVERSVVGLEVKGGVALVASRGTFVEFPTAIGASFAFGLNLTIPRTQWSFQNDFRYLSANAERRLGADPNNYDVHSYDMNYLKLQSMFRYSHQINPTTGLYFQGGMLNGYAVKQKVSITRHFYGTEAELSGIGAPKKFERGLLIGAGVGVRNIYLGLDYEISNGYRYSIFDATFKNLYITAGYRF